MGIIDSLVLGIVEGITEFLPISSTGHLILASRLLDLQSTAFLTSFEIAIQFGAILAVVALYGKKIVQAPTIIPLVALAFLPTAIIGFVVYPLVKEVLLGSETVVLWSLLLGGVGLIVFERLHREKADAAPDLASIGWRQALAIGTFQSIAVIPGISRAAATILGGLLMNVRRTAIVEFSFLLAVPTMAAATGFDLLESAYAFREGELAMLGVGFIASFVTAMIAIRFLLRFITHRSFVSFGIYRMFVAVLFWLFVLI